MKTLNPWDQARKRVLLRHPAGPFRGDLKLEKLDRGANYFILALEELGCRTYYSCEGHPYGFYVTFDARYEIALKIRHCGFFTVEIEGLDYWSIRFGSNKRGSDKWNERSKRQCLRRAANAWEKNLFNR